MSRERRNTFRITFFIKRKKLLKNGEAPVFMRVTINSQIAEFVIKRSVPVNEWNQIKGYSIGKGRLAQELNRYLDTVKANILRIHRELELDGKMVTVSAIRDKYYGRDETKKTLLEIYKDHNLKCEALIGKDFSASTVQKFYTSYKCLDGFIQYRYNKKDIFLSELSGEFIKEFEFYLKATRNLQINSAIKHLKNLKKIIRIALANEWIKKDPFIGIQFKHKEKTVEFLSEEELQRLIEKEFSISRLEVVRDIFVFCCFTGLAFIDVKQLTKDHLTKDHKGNMWIRKNRQKTKNMSTIPLIGAAQKIIQKYEDYPECIKKDVLLPVLSNQKSNAYLKEIADLCGTKKKLTTHMARHSKFWFPLKMSELQGF